MKGFLFLPAVFFLASCASSEKMLSRTWKIDKVVFMDSLSTLNPEQKAQIANQLTHHMSLSFLPDSVYAVSSGGDKTRSKWWLSGDTKTLFTIDPQERVVESKILKLNKNYLEFITLGKGNDAFKFSCSPVKGAK
jgi:hypothetical protein